MSERAVEKHVGSVFQKLGLVHESDVNRRVMAVLAFLEATGRPRPTGEGGQPHPGVRPAPCPRAPGRETMSRSRSGADAEVRVLVVDDQEPFRRAMAAVVDGDRRVRGGRLATTGEESLAAVAELRPDLVLMDVNLPGIDGIEAARDSPPRPAAPVVVLLSTYDEDEFDLDGCGASAYVAKAAFGPDRLSEAWAAAPAPDDAGSSATRPGCVTLSSSVRRGQRAADGLDPVGDRLQVDPLAPRRR